MEEGGMGTTTGDREMNDVSPVCVLSDVSDVCKNSSSVHLTASRVT